MSTSFLLKPPRQSEGADRSPDRLTVIRLIRQRLLRSVFQPLVDMQSGQVLAHEALIRGPEATPYHRPDALFALAHRARLAPHFELACVEQILRDWAAQPAQDDSLLFVNLSERALLHALRDLPGLLPAWKRPSEADVPLTQLVIELTEHEPVGDLAALISARDALRAQGVRIALDDFGSGHANFRLWYELRPDFVKIDQYFVRHLHRHPEKRQFIQALQTLARPLGATLIAEGIETQEEWAVLRDLGIPIGQGFLLGRPDSQPARQDMAREMPLFEARRPTPRPLYLNQPAQPAILAQLELIASPTASPRSTHNEVAAVFQNHPTLHAMPVVDDGGRPVGLLNRQQFMDRFAQLYFREVHGRKPCMISANAAPRIVERTDGIAELIAILISNDQSYLADGFIVTEQGLYAGLGTGEQLVKAVTEARIEAARHANPLTLLPGNIPLNMHVQWLLDGQAAFAACYADLDHFTFNDHYGYRSGDDMIQLVARLATAHCEPGLDFVGHIGGDDFLLLLRSPDWAARCEAICREFSSAALELFDLPARQAGGFTASDRNGSPQFFPLTTLSIGAVAIAPGQYRDAQEVGAAAAQAKHDAKNARQGLRIRAS
ncbi:MAG: putative cyclic di-GMP phosphodiesterase PdeA [Paracidovorax wautersii]|uniref:Putative cyclic di-GMP phosphodiesterase PdeA n=1 Tax=Paracidovorax wautersii TaxID=1177982 RepID=A0A7V8FNI9_9BURK|nr:MAG: putative cyclic di-GMP phosphodiesterase PdeA [Paracidovorax wautersii]